MDRFRAQRGVTLIEVLVAILVGVIALLGLYQLVDASNKLTKQQTEVSDVQQSARIGVSELSRIIRQSRVGGLYFGNAVVPVANNGTLLPNADVVGYGGLPMTDLSGTVHAIRPGTDVIEVRGVLFESKYTLDENNVTCLGSCGPVACPVECDRTTNVTVSIPQKTALGFVNFPTDPAPGTACQSPTPPASCLPVIAGKTGFFYFVVRNGENQQITVNGLTYLVPIYVAGLVNTTGTWYTYTPEDRSTNPPVPAKFTFKMNPQDAGAMKLDATAVLPSSLSKTISGGPIDVVRFFLDDRGDTHPSLAEATLDASTGATNPRWDIQTLVEDVEDLQIAYGVDGATCPTNPACHDDGVSPVTIDLTGVNKDEWVGNVATEVEDTLRISAPDPNHSGVDAFIDPSIPSLQAGACPPQETCNAIPALRSVWISLVVKSTDPEIVYDGPGARGIKILDSAAVSFSASTGRPYRRRPLSLAVSLRNNTVTNR